MQERDLWFQALPWHPQMGRYLMAHGLGPAEECRFTAWDEKLHGSRASFDGPLPPGADGAMNGLTPQLLAWLARVLPAVDLSRVRLTFADRLPFDWVSSRKDGITLGRDVYLRSRYLEQLRLGQPNAVELLCHELTHVEQFQGRVFWPVLYLCQHRELEAQAYQRARELRALWEAR